MEYDVVIVGGGPSGLATAINLKQLKSDQNSILTDDNFNVYKLTDFIYF